MKVVDILEAEKKDDAGDTPTYVRPDTAEVAKHVYPFLVEKIIKINKRAIKNNLPEVKLEIVKEYMKEKKSDQKPREGDRPVQIPYYTVKITGDAPKIAGHKFIATIEHQAGGNIIRTVPGEEGTKKIEEFYKAKPDYCDHCKKVRNRIDTFVIKEEKTGKLRQIGRNCLADFLGGADPKNILWYFNNRDSLGKLIEDAEGQAGRKGARVDTFVPLNDVLEIGSALIRELGFMSTKKSQEISQSGGWPVPTTAGDVRWILFGDRSREAMRDPRNERLDAIGRSVGPADKKQVKEVLDWFDKLPDDQKSSNEFMHNLDVIVKSSTVNPRNIGYAVALFPVYARAMNLIKQKSEQTKKSNEWLGQPGQKLPPTKVKVVRTRSIESNFGYRGGTTQIVAMEDPEGNQLTWFNNSAEKMEDGKEYTITGTIKKHDTYNGKKQTHVMRVKAS